MKFATRFENPNTLLPVSSSAQTGPPREQTESEIAAAFQNWGSDLPRLPFVLRAVLGAATDEELGKLWVRLETTGASWGYHAPDPLARLMSRAVLDLVIDPDSVLEGIDALACARSHPTVLMSNHLSFVDLNVVDSLVARTPMRDIADRMTVVAGPKVFAEPVRRLASLCFGTLKIPQSQSRASGEARMRPREVARISAEVIQIVHERQAAGQPLAVFIEGSRSRTGAMTRALPAVSRYLEGQDLQLLPWALEGTDRLVPIGTSHFFQAPVRVRIGQPIPAAILRERCARKRTLMMDTVGFLIAALLAEPYRGVYGEHDETLAQAHQIADTLMPRP